MVAVVEWTGGLDPATLYESFQAVMANVGLEVLLAEVHQLTTSNGKLHLDGRPIDVALRYFTLGQACEDPNAEELIDPILRAHDAGETCSTRTWKPPAARPRTTSPCSPTRATAPRSALPRRP